MKQSRKRKKGHGLIGGALSAGAAVAVCVVGILTTVGILRLIASIAGPSGMPSVPVLLVAFGVPAAVIACIVFALAQRIREIRRGEMDEAEKY